MNCEGAHWLIEAQTWLLVIVLAVAVGILVIGVRSDIRRR